MVSRGIIFLGYANVLSINFNCCSKHVQQPTKTWPSLRTYVSQALADGAVFFVYGFHSINAEKSLTCSIGHLE